MTTASIGEIGMASNEFECLEYLVPRKRGIVSSSQTSVTTAGIRIFGMGGNCVDASAGSAYFCVVNDIF